MEEIYQSIFADHAQNPRNIGELLPPAIHMQKVNKLCGDDITIYVEITGDKVKNASFTSIDSTPLCNASASVMCEFMLNNKISAIIAGAESLIFMLDKKDKNAPLPEGLEPLRLVLQSPRRIPNVKLPIQLVQDLLKSL